MLDKNAFREKCRLLGAKIKYYRTIHGMNQTMLAEKLHFLSISQPDRMRQTKPQLFSVSPAGGCAGCGCSGISEWKRRKTFLNKIR